MTNFLKVPPTKVKPLSCLNLLSKYVIQFILTCMVFLFSIAPTYTQNIFPSTGKVGIGTTTPISELEVKSNSGTNSEIHINTTSDNGVSILRFQDANLSTWGFLSNYPGVGEFSLHNYQNNTNSFVIDQNGNFGIGTTAADAKLTVNGDIHAEEVKVDLSVPGPDYVFKDDYDLRTLKETKDYIQEHGHLPNIPSAKEMEENGVKLGVMNMKLLEKIEELTLYIIGLKKETTIQITELKREIKYLKAKLR